MKKWCVYLNLDVQDCTSYVYIQADNVMQHGETKVIADTVIIDFGNEILGLSEVKDE